MGSINPIEHPYVFCSRNSANFWSNQSCNNFSGNIGRFIFEKLQSTRSSAVRSNGRRCLVCFSAKNLRTRCQTYERNFFDAGFSYPSGHSAGCIVFGGVLAYFAWRRWQSTRSRALIGSGLCVVVGVVGFDRLYLNVHWVSDVFDGWLFGAFWLSFVILVFRQLKLAGKFESERLGLIVNLLYLVAFVIAVFVALYGLICNSLSFQ
jgi:hypothetical protein